MERTVAAYKTHLYVEVSGDSLNTPFSPFLRIIFRTGNSPVDRLRLFQDSFDPRSYIWTHKLPKHSNFPKYVKKMPEVCINLDLTK